MEHYKLALKIFITSNSILFFVIKDLRLLIPVLIAIVALAFKKKSTTLNKLIEGFFAFMGLTLFNLILLIIYIFINFPLGLISKKSHQTRGILKVKNEKINFDRLW